MQLKLIINEHTTDSELVHLGNFFSALGLNRGAHVISAPADEAELEVPEVPEPSYIPLNREEPVVHVEVPKRRRRTKEEIAAAEAAAVAAAEAEAQARNEAALAAAEDAAKAEAGKGDPAPTPSVEPQGTPPAEEPASTQPATAAPSDTKTYTPAEVQKIAVATAGRFGPEKVKAIIAQYPGAARIADLPLTELAGFVAKLNAVS